MMLLLRQFILFLTIIPLWGSGNSPHLGKAGILAMAHGGDPEWNAAVQDAVAPLRAVYPVSLALGMAQRDSLQAAVRELEYQKVKRIAVVRLFVSAESFRSQTEYLLGLSEHPPQYFIQHTQKHIDSIHNVQMLPKNLAPPPIETRATVELNRNGLYDSEEVGQIAVERVLHLSRSPQLESILILAHGEGDDDINRQWITKLQNLANHVAAIRPFRAVKVETLREDWQDKRSRAEKRIRDFVTAANRRGGRVLVVPFRVYGFGPYADVLKGLDYVSDGRGLLPHATVTRWIKQQAEDCFQRMVSANSGKSN